MNCLRRSRLAFRHPCATLSPRVSPTRNMSLPYACSKAGEWRRINPAPPAGSSAPPRLASPQRNIDLVRCTRRALAWPRDPAAAKRWYLKAAEAGNGRAAHNLAVMNTDSAAGRAELSGSGEMVPKGGRAWRPRQPVQSRDPLRARSRRRKGSRSVVSVVLACRSARRYGRRQETRRDCRRAGRGLARLRGGGVDEIQGRQAQSSRKRRRRPAGGLGCQVGSLAWPIAAPRTRLTRSASLTGQAASCRKSRARS